MNEPKSAALVTTADAAAKRLTGVGGWRGHSLVQLTLLRFREFVREPEAIFWAFAFPVLLTTGLGIAFRSQPPEVARVAAVTPQLAAALRQAPFVAVQELSADAAHEALRLGRVTLVVEPGANGSVTYRYDDSNPEARNTRFLVDHAVQSAAGRADPVAVVDEVTPEVGGRYIDFLVPGLVAMGIMSSAVWGPGFSIVDARRRKVMKRLAATPMPRRHFLGSFLIWRLLFLVVEVGVPVGFGAVAFGVPIRGSVIDLAIIAVLGSLAFSAIGLLVGSRARTIEAVTGIVNVVMIPMWILSGIFFSATRFPDVMQPVIRALPLTALVDALRANMLQGASLMQVAPELAALTVCTVVCFGLALRLFRWQ
ncbi:MAG: ABC transporter permease [Acidobacteriota bacterium]